MPRQLTFRIKSAEYSVTPVKIDRKKLYGWTSILALDEDGRECTLVSTDDTGSLIIPKGGTSIGILSPDGDWIDRAELISVKLDGTPAELKPSSYTITNDLKRKVTEEEFLNYSITDFYELGDTSEKMLKAIGKDIYRFDYAYLDSYETTPAFLMVSGGTLFMLLGYENRFDMLCLGDCKTVDEDDDDFIDVTADEIDFSMF